MRERWARLLAAATGTLVLLISLGFGLLQNPLLSTPARAGSAPPETRPGAVAGNAPAGRAVYDEQGCARCHSIAGQGSPRSPLDGVGTRLVPVEIRQWIVGDEAIREDLSPRALDAKRAYATLPAEQLDALVAYLAGLRE